MLKKEAIWREILIQARMNKKAIFTQKELAAYFGFSLSTVFNALKVLRAANIISVSGRNFRLESYQKLLYLWASFRTFRNDLAYSARIALDPKKIESSVPPDSDFGLYSASVLLYHIEPADYDHIYLYADEARIAEIFERFPGADLSSKNPNFFILKKDQWLTRYAEMPLEQIFVDIWNAPEWYAKDFLKNIEDKLLP
ncbi:MAG: hypothetical protein UV01_C0004G0061 [Parcubacteria group bacterium GW2011_GWA2_42_14]|nr:MAG: hypothetical protein UV01_C0004G0061 [Parcubacteria group bacterium GW2011_GWA2_42_14]